MLRELLPVVIAGLVPFAVLTLIVLGTAVNLVAWQPYMIHTTLFETNNSSNIITGLSSDSSGIYASGVVPNGYLPLSLTKYDLSGHQLWTQRFGNYSDSQILAVGAGEDCVYIVVNSGLASQSFVRKYDSSGNQVWTVNFDNFSQATALSVSGTRVYVSVLTSRGDNLDSYSADGSLVWSRQITNYNYTADINIYTVATSVYVIDGAANVHTGQAITLFQKYDQDGGLLWNSTVPAVSFGPSGITGDSGGIYTVGPGQSINNPNGFLTKFGFNGTQLWTTSVNAPGNAGIQSAVVSADSSGIYLASTTNTGKGLVMKYDRNGNLAWTFELPWDTGLGSFPVDSISVSGMGVYVGGDLLVAGSVGGSFLTELGKSSSLIFFGVVPPLSFGIVATLAAVAACGILLFRRQWKNRPLPGNPNTPDVSKKTPSDKHRRT